MEYYDELEIRSENDRALWLAEALPGVVARAKTAPALARILQDIEPDQIVTRQALASLPVIRRAELAEAQQKSPPFGGFTTRHAHEFENIFQCAGPLYGPGRRGNDWWRLGRFLFAAGVGPGDIVHNSFGYHLTPEGMMFESAARAVDAAVLPAGTGQIELQLRAAVDLGCTVYAGPVDHLRELLSHADKAGQALALTRATVAAPLPEDFRQTLADRGIIATQCHARGEVGLIAYEAPGSGGLIVDEGVLVEILDPATAEPVPDGETGEIVITTMNADYPLLRYATGEFSAVVPGESPCGRTNMRIRVPERGGPATIL